MKEQTNKVCKNEAKNKLINDAAQSNNECRRKESMTKEEDWMKFAVYYNSIRECRVPEEFDERVTEEEFRDHMLRESKKRGRKVLDGFVLIKNEKKTGRIERVEREVVSLNGMRVCI